MPGRERRQHWHRLRMETKRNGDGRTVAECRILSGKRTFIFDMWAFPFPTTTRHVATEKDDTKKNFRARAVLSAHSKTKRIELFTSNSTRHESSDFLRLACIKLLLGDLSSQTLQLKSLRHALIHHRKTSIPTQHLSQMLDERYVKVLLKVTKLGLQLLYLKQIAASAIELFSNVSMVTSNSEVHNEMVIAGQ